MSNKNTSRTTGVAAIFAGTMVALLAACSQTVETAADAATLSVPSSTTNEGAASTDLPEIVIVASRDEPRNRG